MTVAEGKICTSILELYNRDAIVVEPAGALSIAALDTCRQQIKGKTVVCVVSGSNNDIERMQEIKERSLQHEGLKHYFLIRFAQRPGALKDFVNQVLGPHDDITRFEYMQKHSKETGPALVGISLQSHSDYQRLLENFRKYNYNYTERMFWPVRISVSPSESVFTSASCSISSTSAFSSDGKIFEISVAVMKQR